MFAIEKLANSTTHKGPMEVRLTRNSLTTAFLMLAAMLFASTAPATADSYMEVEAARANARAGGPTNAHDAELLRKYGMPTNGHVSPWRYHRHHRYTHRHARR